MGLKSRVWGSGAGGGDRVEGGVGDGVLLGIGQRIGGWVEGEEGGGPDEVVGLAEVEAVAEAAVVFAVVGDAPDAGGGEGEAEGLVGGEGVCGWVGQEVGGDEFVPGGGLAVESPGEEAEEGLALGFAAEEGSGDAFPSGGDEELEEFAHGVIGAVEHGAGGLEAFGGGFLVLGGVAEEGAEFVDVALAPGIDLGGGEAVGVVGVGGEGVEEGLAIGGHGGEGGGFIEGGAEGGPEAGFALGGRLGRGHAEGGEAAEEEVGVEGIGEAIDDDLDDEGEFAPDGAGEGEGGEAVLGVEGGEELAGLVGGEGGFGGEPVNAIEGDLPEAGSLDDRDDALVAGEGVVGEVEVAKNEGEGEVGTLVLPGGFGGGEADEGQLAEGGVVDERGFGTVDGGELDEFVGVASGVSKAFGEGDQGVDRFGLDGGVGEGKREVAHELEEGVVEIMDGGVEVAPGLEAIFRRGELDAFEEEVLPRFGINRGVGGGGGGGEGGEEAGSVERKE